MAHQMALQAGVSVPFWCMSSLKLSYLSGGGKLAHKLIFSALHRYDPAQDGIDPPIRLSIGEKIIDLVAKVDTGASCCIFKR